MKKLIALLLIFATLAAFFTGCTTPPDDETPVTDDPTSNGTEDPTSNGTEDPTEDTGGDEKLDWDSFECITVAEALAMTLSDGETTEERYYIRGTVTTMMNAAFGEMTLTDETGSIYVYGTYSEDGSLKYSQMTEKAFTGDQVLLHCTIKNHDGVIEINNARLIDFIPAELDADTTGYTEMTIAQAREAATGDKVLVSGVVAQITYAFGQVPSGVILVDNTSSIYIYSKDIAGRAAIGNTISVAASKTYWILEDEQSHADTYGYKGCNQLENAQLVSIDNSITDFDTSWIEETTIMELLDKPASEDFTSKIYKVTARVHLQEGAGFDNYWFYDLDMITGSYTYTQCSGSDFEWVREFDGSFCTVYLMVLNAKSTSTGCVYRFLPVKIVDEGFDPAQINGAEYGVKYMGLTQFSDTYTGDPNLALYPDAYSQVLNIYDVALSYSSSDTSIIDFESLDGMVYMHCKASGTATVTVTGTHEGKTYSESITITVDLSDQSGDYSTVSDAISAAVGDTVTVKGIVGPSLAHKVGFYLIDDTGVISVIVDNDTLATLNIGDEIVLEGMRDRFYDSEKNGGLHAGQICLTNCTLKSNRYGDHAYSTKSFDGTITVQDFYNLDYTVDHSTDVYTMTATIVIDAKEFYSNYYISDGTTKITLYSNGQKGDANTYAWLEQYAGQEATFEIAPCNWNNKKFYAGCVLSITLSDGTKILNEQNFN